METITIFQTIWFILIGVLLLGYSILDGFDLGIGILMPYLARDEKERITLFQAIGPFWDGNEVWLLTGGGALFAAFPHAYATAFSGFYLAIMLVLFALIFRAVSIEFYLHDTANRSRWQWCFTIGSFLPALLFGVALGNVIVGIPMHNMEFTGTFFTLLRPFPIIIGLLGFIAVLLQGTTFAMVKSRGAIRERALSLAVKLRYTFIVIFIVTLTLARIYLPEASGNTAYLLFVPVAIGGWLLLHIFIKKQKDFFAFLSTSLIFAGLWGMAAGLHFPYLVRAQADIAGSLTVFNASSSLLTLQVMLVFAAIGLPLILFYTYYVYKTFKEEIS